MYTTIISTEDLAQIQSTDGGPSVVVVDCRSSLTDATFGKRAYDEGHIPGAFFADLGEDLARHGDKTQGRHPLPDAKAFCDFLGSLGIDATTQVVTYDDVSGAIAGRLWWMLSRWMGHRAVAVLDGGIKSWVAQEREISTEAPSRVQGTYAGTADDSAWITTDELVAAIADDSVVVVDARTTERYNGESEPIDPIAGHIPGAVNLFIGGNLAKGHYAEADVLRERFAAVTDTAGGASNIVHSCGSGVSALHNMIAMEHAGLSGSRLYVGSWSEWIRDPARTVATNTG